MRKLIMFIAVDKLRLREFRMNIGRMISFLIGFVSLTACVSTDTGGLLDLKSSESLVTEFELEKPAWNSPPELEIVADGELVGFYTRSSKPGKLIDTATVLDLDKSLIYTIQSELNDEGRILNIRDTEGRLGRISAAYSPSAGVGAEVDLFDWQYGISSGYARKGGADGYRHRQWFFSALSGTAFVSETKIWESRDQNQILATADVLSRENEALLFAGVSLVFLEMDAADRAREAQERALNQVANEGKKQAGFSFGTF